MTPEGLEPSALRRLVGADVASVEAIGGGRNSRVYRLATPQGDSYALKAYHRHPGDTRDRLGTEFRSLTFLWAQGFRCVPEPLAMDGEAGWGLYTFLPGGRPDTPSGAEVEEAWRFLASLREASRAPGAADLPVASEASFSLAALLGHLRLRAARFDAVDGETRATFGLGAFLEAELAPVWREAEAACRAAYQRHGVAEEAELPAGDRTLSPSDFGFHNALRGPQGLAFVDFEYFGWDDPAKMLSDFLLHPGMTLDLSHRRRFTQGLLSAFPREALAWRAQALYPLFGIKWCFILLNEFLQGDLDRRRFAEGAGSESARRTRQLGRARAMLHHLRDDHAHLACFAN